MRLPNALKEGFVKLALDLGFDMDVVPFDLFIEFVDYKHRLMCSRFVWLLQPSSYKSTAHFKSRHKARANVVQATSDSVSKQLEREKPTTQARLRSNAIRRPWIFAQNAALNIVIKTDLNSTQQKK